MGRKAPFSCLNNVILDIMVEVLMDYYDTKIKNPKINGKELIVDGEINKELAIPPSKLIIGEGLSVTKIDGKFYISLDRTGIANGISARNNNNGK